MNPERFHLNPSAPSQGTRDPLCSYAGCGTPGAKKPLCGAPDTATDQTFFNTIEPEYVHPEQFTGCYPGYNERDGACYVCGVTPDALVAGSKLGGTDALQLQTRYPAWWDGVLETQLWRSRCDFIGCGMQSWPALPNEPYNATAGRSQPFEVCAGCLVAAGTQGH